MTQKIKKFSYWFKTYSMCNTNIVIIIIIIIIIIIYLTSFQIRTDSYKSKNFHKVNKIWPCPRRHMHCFNWKRAFRSFTVCNSAILPFVNFGSQNKLKITNIRNMSWANLTLTSATVPSFDFIFKELQWCTVLNFGG